MEILWKFDLARLDPIGKKKGGTKVDLFDGGRLGHWRPGTFR